MSLLQGKQHVPVSLHALPTTNANYQESVCRSSCIHTVVHKSNSLSTLETIVADFGDNRRQSPFSVSVAEIGDYILQSGLYRA